MVIRKKKDSPDSAPSATMLIIGGGAAGMTAAGALSAKGIRSIVVEAKKRVGGLAVELACKGSRECVRCDVCLGTEKATEACQSSGVRILAESRIIGMREEGTLFAVEIVDREGTAYVHEVDGIIVCTGTEPMDPGKFSRYRYGEVPGVVSALDVEHELNAKGNWGENVLGKAAFVQCVGSRGEKGGVEYCSTVCCKYALKLAKSLSNQYPDSEVSFFFMDWRPCDGAQKDLQSWAASAKARLVRSRPAEIFKSDAGKPTLRYATQEEEIVDEEFDLVILSVGIVPSAGTVQVAGILGIELDEDGFVKTVPGSNQTSRKGIFAAGSASRPCDLERSVTSGIAAASEAAAFLGKRTGLASVAVLGRIDNELIAESKKLGMEIIQIPWDRSPGLELSGRLGDFVLRGNLTSMVHCQALIVSLPSESCPSPSGVISLEEFEKLLAAGKPPLDTAFILQESDHCSAHSQHHERALKGALKIKEGNPEKNVTIVAPEFVAFAQLERLYKRCQERGVVFVRQAEFPKILEGGLELFDPISQTNFRIVAERVIVAGDYLSAEARERLLGLRLNLEDDGRAETRPVKWKPSGCLRKGIYLCGSPWDTEESRRLDLRAALAGALASLQNPKASELLAETDEKKCSACLSCIRSCPFEAPYMNREGLAEINSELCQGCGICVGVCPSQAISLRPSEEGQ